MAFSAKNSLAALDKAIKAYSDTSIILSKDLQELIQNIQNLSKDQQDQNFDAFNKAVQPRNERIKEIAEYLKTLSTFLENDFKPIFKEYLVLEHGYDGN